MTTRWPFRGHWLCHLQMGEAGHWRIVVCLGFGDQRIDQHQQLFVDLIDLITQPQPYIGDAFVISTAGSM